MPVRKKNRYLEFLFRSSSFVRIKSILDSFFDRVDIVLQRFPLLFSLFVGLISRYSFTDREISSLFIISLFSYFRILGILFVQKCTVKFFLSGLFFGMAIYFNAFSWLLSLREFGFKTANIEDFLGIFGFFGASLYLSIYTGLASYFASKLAFNKISLFLFFSCFVTIYEIFSRYIVDLAPLLSLSYGIVGFKYFIQVGAIVGTFGITFLSLLVVSFLSVKGYRYFGCLVFLFCNAYGLYKIKLKNDYLMPKDKFDIAVVQANYDDNDRFSSGYACSDNFATLAKIDSVENLKKKLLVIAPETIIWYSVPQIEYFVKRGCGFYKNDGYLNEKRYSNVGEDKLSNIVVCTGFVENVCGKSHNSYQFFTYDYGLGGIKRLDFYNKKYLIPFGEMLPTWVNKVIHLVPKRFKFIHEMIDEFNDSSYTPGDGKNTIHIDGVAPFAMEICSDIISPGLSLYDSYEPTWILSTMNFHTFNGKDKNTNLSHLGLLFGKFRAIEFSRPVVMCINFGYSCVIDCNGQVVKILKSKAAGAIHHEMPMKYDVSIFSMFRQKMLLSILLFLFVSLLLARRKKNGRFKKFFSKK